MHKNAYEMLTENGDGKDPRELTVEELNESGIFDRPLMQVIRSKCIDCCGGSSDEVKKCTAVSCPLWAFRMNKNPFRKRNLTDKQRKEIAERLKESRK